MQWILFFVVGLAALLLALIIAGMLLPAQHVVTSWIDLPQPPEEVWPVVRDLGQVPAFWRDMKSSERRPDRAGTEVWSQTMKNGFVIPLEIVEDRPPNRLVTRIAMEGRAPFGGSWIYDIAAQGAGSRVRLTEDGWVSNPFFRVISRVMGHHTTLDSYLDALGKRWGATGKPAHETNK